jgi:hypothetical protein
VPKARRRNTVVRQIVVPEPGLGPLGGSHIAPRRAQGDFDLSGKIAHHVLQRMAAQNCQNVKDTIVA